MTGTIATEERLILSLLAFAKQGIFPSLISVSPKIYRELIEALGSKVMYADIDFCHNKEKRCTAYRCIQLEVYTYKYPVYIMQDRG